MKFFIFCVIITGMLIILNIGGIETPATGSVLTALNVDITSSNVSVGSISDSQLFGDQSSGGLPIGLKYLLITAVIGGIAIGIFGRAPDVSYLIGALVFTVGTILVSDMVFIMMLLINNGESWMKFVAVGIFVPMIIGFYATLISYWRGTDG